MDVMKSMYDYPVIVNKGPGVEKSCSVCGTNYDAYNVWPINGILRVLKGGCLLLKI